MESTAMGTTTIIMDGMYKSRSKRNGDRDTATPFLPHTTSKERLFPQGEFVFLVE